MARVTETKTGGAPRKYRLLLVRPEDVPKRAEHYLTTPDWTLLYTDGRAPKLSREIRKEDLKKLPPIAVEWLSDTIREIQMKHISENAPEFLRRGKAFMDRFEAELEAEREKAEGGDGVAG